MGKIKNPAILSFLIKTISRGPFYQTPKCDHLSPLIELIATYQTNQPKSRLERLFLAIDEIPGILLPFMIPKCQESHDIVMSIFENLYMHLGKIPIGQWNNVLQIACHFSDFYTDNLSPKKELIEDVYKNPSLYLGVWIQSEKICPWIYDSSMRSLAAFLKCKLRNRLANEKEVIKQLVTYQLPFFLEYLPPGVDDNDRFYPLCITGEVEEKPTLSLLSSQIKKNPTRVIRLIGSTIIKCHAFFVKYYGQEGIDEGGLSRDFFASLFREFKNTPYMLADMPVYHPSVPIRKQRRLFHYISGIIDF